MHAALLNFWEDLADEIELLAIEITMCPNSHINAVNKLTIEKSSATLRKLQSWSYILSSVKRR